MLVEFFSGKNFRLIIKFSNYRRTVSHFTIHRQYNRTSNYRPTHNFTIIKPSWTFCVTCAINLPARTCITCKFHLLQLFTAAPIGYSSQLLTVTYTAGCWITAVSFSNKPNVVNEKRHKHGDSWQSRGLPSLYDRNITVTHRLLLYSDDAVWHQTPVWCLSRTSGLSHA